MHAAFDLPPHEWRRLRALLDAALDQPAGARAEWLDALDDDACGSLKPRLRALLHHAGDAPPAAARLLDTLPAVETGQFAPGPGSDQQAGQTVGPYRLLHELGAGGMASVWLAERTDMLHGRKVALKLPHGAWRRADLAERLAREREILATLEHPNIARLYDAGVDAQGRPYLALEHVEGERIDAWCQRHALDVAARLRLVLQVARALAHAHAHLVVHRDLKPGNVLVTEAGDVKLLDFGIAKLLEGGREQQTALTQAGARVLTPDYAAPEQILGQPVGTVADVYALGVLLFELLTDVRPYRLQRTSRAALEEAILHADPPRPSSVAPPARRRALRGDLDTIVGKALKKAPGERYATVQALADDLERHLARRPVRARPDSAGYRAHRFVLRNRLAVSAAAAVALALLGGAGAALWQAAQARAEQQRAEAVKAFVGGLFIDADPFQTASAGPSAEDLLDAALARLPAALPANAALRAELLVLIGDSLVGLSRFDRADDVLAQAVEEARQALGPEHPLTRRARVSQVGVQRMRGRTAQAGQALSELLPPLRAAPGAAPAALVDALHHSAHLAIDGGRHAEAQATAREALALAERHLGRLHPATVRSALLVTSADQFGADPGRTLASALRSRALAIELHGEQRPHARVLDARFMYGRALGNAGRIDEAVAELAAVLQQVRSVLGAQAPMAAFVAADIARFALERGDAASSLQHAEQASAILAADAPAGSYTLAMLHFGRGRALQALHRNAAADEVLQQARATLALARGADSPLLADIDAVRALALAQDGQLDAAWALLAPQLDTYRAQPPLRQFRGLHAAGRVRRWFGDAAGAQALQQEALAALPAHPAHAARRDEVRAEQARLALDAGAPDTALALLDQQERKALPGPPATPAAAEAALTRGRALLAGGRAADALPLLAGAADHWQQSQPGGRWAGEAAFWLGRCQADLGLAAQARASFGRAAGALAGSPFGGDERLGDEARRGA